jgi:hypothetical protein
MRWGRACSPNGGKGNAYRLLVGKSEEKEPPGRQKRRLVGNIKMGLLERAWGGVDWISMAQDREKWRAPMNAAMKLRVPKNSGKLSSSYTIGGLLSSAKSHKVSLIVMYMYIYIVAWHILNLRIELQPPALNTQNKQPRKYDKEWSSRLGIAHGTNNPSL